MNGTDSHTLNLTAGDVLQVVFKSEKGSLHMEITAPDGTILYAGNGEEVTEFEISISQTGAYTITVEVRHAEGSIYILQVGNLYTNLGIFTGGTHAQLLRAGSGQDQRG